MWYPTRILVPTLISLTVVACEQTQTTSPYAISPQFGTDTRPQLAYGPESHRPEIHPELKEMIQNGPNPGAKRAPLQKEINLVGYLDLSPGLASDVWVHGDAAYVGGFATAPFQNPTVKVVSISDPANPEIVTELSAPNPYSSPQDIKVARVNTRFFHGDLMVVGLDGFGGGIQLWDVTSPLNPILVFFLRNPADGAWFIHNAYLYQQGNRAYVAMVSPFEEDFGFSGRGDVIFVDVTDPANPAVVGDWGAGKDGGFPTGFLCPDVCRGEFPASFAHDVWVNEQGTLAYVAYWDLGLILLDISDPSNPAFLGRGIEPPTFGNDDGDLHVAVPAQGGNLVLVGDEDASPAFGGSLPWGFMRIFDTSNPTNPVEIGAYATDGALNDPTFDDPYERTMHNVVVRGSRAYLSWYGEGIRVVDISQPWDPREIAAFVPPEDLGPAVFWGVYAERDLVLGSDLFGGLFILKTR